MLTGGDGLQQFVPGTDTKGLGPDKPAGGLLHPGWYDGFLFSQALTIGGGTGDVQRNIVGERVLGLPHDCRRDDRHDLGRNATSRRSGLAHDSELDC